MGCSGEDNRKFPLLFKNRTVFLYWLTTEKIIDIFMQCSCCLGFLKVQKTLICILKFIPTKVVTGYFFFFNNEMYVWLKILLRWNIRILAFQSRQQSIDDTAVVSPGTGSYYFIAKALIILQTSHSAAQKMMKTQSTNSKWNLPIIILVDLGVLQVTEMGVRHVYALVKRKFLVFYHLSISP